MKKVFRFIFSFIKILFIIFLSFYLGFIILQRLSGNKSIMGYRLFSVATGSMIGVYNVNDVIVVKDYDSNKLKVGDDIAYRGERGGFEGMLITHRIIKIEKNDSGKKVFYTKGVNSTVEDPSIESRQILGKVVGVVPIITQLNHIMKNQLGFFFLIFLPIVLVLVIEVIKTIKELKKEKSILSEKKQDEVVELPVMISSQEVNNNDAVIVSSYEVEHEKVDKNKEILDSEIIDDEII